MSDLDQAPDHDPDNFLTPIEARDAAELEVLGTPLLIASWLAHECATEQGNSVVVDPLTKRVDHSWTVAQLVAAITIGRPSDILKATYEIRARAITALEHHIDHRAQVIFNQYNGNDQRRH